MSAPLLSVENLTVEYFHGAHPVAAVRDVSFSLNEGTTLGLVGESGCGKSSLALSLMGLLPKEEGRVSSGQIRFHDKNLLTQTPEEWQALRGGKIAMIFQDPFSCLNPVLRIDYQLQEAIQLEEGKPNEARALHLLRQVQLSDPERILVSYPHQISGGQRQRVMIAMALARNPELLIADEPTTALDVTIQDEIMTLLMDIQKKMKMSLLFVTHNMGLVKQVSDMLAVMYAGQIVEMGRTQDILSDPKHPYTQGLLKCIPRLERRKKAIPVLQGQPPEPSAIPVGCPFHPRCEKIFDPCSLNDPTARKTGRQQVRCHLYES